jgi:hypothetical protein
MQTLVIHPFDESTRFLKPIYAGLKGDVTVIEGGISKDELRELIREADRVMMMGHGSPAGLFACGMFRGCVNNAMIIDVNTVPALQNKECILIWCNADKYFHRYNLKGFSTSMFISEVSEARYCRVYGTDQEIVDESNNYFAIEMGKISNKPIREIYSGIKSSYGILAESNPVAYYNWSRFHLNE